LLSVEKTFKFNIICSKDLFVEILKILQYFHKNFSVEDKRTALRSGGCEFKSCWSQFCSIISGIARRKCGLQNSKLSSMHSLDGVFRAKKNSKGDYYEAATESQNRYLAARERIIKGKCSSTNFI
jgi:hypothetical protein